MINIYKLLCIFAGIFIVIGCTNSSESETVSPESLEKKDSILEELEKLDSESVINNSLEKNSAPIQVSKEFKLAFDLFQVTLNKECLSCHSTDSIGNFNKLNSIEKWRNSKYLNPSDLDKSKIYTRLTNLGGNMPLSGKKLDSRDLDAIKNFLYFYKLLDKKPNPKSSLENLAENITKSDGSNTTLSIPKDKPQLELDNPNGDPNSTENSPPTTIIEAFNKFQQVIENQCSFCHMSELYGNFQILDNHSKWLESKYINNKEPLKSKIFVSLKNNGGNMPPLGKQIEENLYKDIEFYLLRLAENDPTSNESSNPGGDSSGGTEDPISDNSDNDDNQNTEDSPTDEENNNTPTTNYCENPGIQKPALKRLSRSEYNNTMNFFTNLNKKWLEVSDPIIGGYQNNWQQTKVSKEHATQFLDNAIEASEHYYEFKISSKVANCSPGYSESCLLEVGNFLIEDLYREPQKEEITNDLVSIFNNHLDSGIKNAYKAVISSIFFSPSFLYRSEIGELVSDSERSLSQFEIARNISFSLTGLPPDDLLVQAAKRGDLTNSEKRLSEVQRLLSDSSSDHIAKEFANSWLEISENKPSSSTVSESLFADSQKEINLISKAIFNTGKPEDFILSKASYLNKNLGNHYEISSGDNWNKVQSDKRKGMLTSAAFSISHSDHGNSSPIKRGLVVARKMLCIQLPPPPANISLMDDDSSNSLKSTREKFEQHSNNPQCATCHKHFDPLGFALEDIGGDGKKREFDNTVEVNTAVSFLSEDDKTYSIKNSSELMTQMADETRYYDCFYKNMETLIKGSTSTTKSCQMNPTIVSNVRNNSVKQTIETFFADPNYLLRK